MTKFNTKDVQTTKAISYEGGQVYSKSVEDEWINALFSSILQPRFYESAEKQQQRFIDLTEAMIAKYGPHLISKAAIFSRNELGMRSISELTAAILNKYQWVLKREFYKSYFHRPDGIGEVFAAIDELGGKRSHALVRGAADYLNSLTAYQIGKYPMRNHKYTMHDIINITHAKSEVIDKYQKNILEAPDTWEVKIHSLQNDDEAREKEWKRLVEEHKLGYLALLRNLRAICKCSFATTSWCKEYLVPQIVNEVSIKKSLVWPLQIYTEWKTLNQEGIGIEIEQALSDAFEISTQNMPYLDGKTLVVLDVSGSMESKFNKGSLTIKEVCAVYASAFLKSEFKDNVEFIKFGSTAKWYHAKFNSGNVFKLIQELADNDNCGYSTEIASVFNLIDRHYDRVFLFSDMQVMDGGYWDRSASQRWNYYVENYGKSHMYSFDLGNYHNQLLPQNNTISYITALNDIVFKIIDIQENDSKSLLDMIREYEYHFVD